MSMPLFSFSRVTGHRFHSLLLLFAGMAVLLPLILNALGFDFGANRSGIMHGLLVHTVLLWTATCLAFFTFLLAFFHYYVKRDIVMPVMGISLLWGGFIDMFQTLGADRILQSTSAEMQLIPFTWAIGRTFGILTLLLGVMILMVRRYRGSIHGDMRLFILVALAMGLGSFAVMDYLTNTTTLPESIFPDAIISRPWDVFPLFLYALAGLWIFRTFYRDRKDYFSFSIWLSVIPDIVAQLHMAFGSSVLFDNNYILAHVLKVVSYMIPGIGLLKEYLDTHTRLAVETDARRKVENDHRRLAQLVDGTQDMVALLDLQGRFRYVNRSLSAQLGMDWASMPGMYLARIINGVGNEPRVQAMIERSISYRQDRGEVELSTLDGSRLIPVEYWMFPLGDAEDLLGVVLRDVTAFKQQTAERLRHERHLQRVISARSAELAAEKAKLRTELAEGERLKARFVEAQKMEAIGQLSTGIAHEINNPLGFVRVNLQVMREYVARYENAMDEMALVDPKAQQVIEEHQIVRYRTDMADLLQESSQGLDRAVDIIKGLKNYAHPGDDSMEPVHLPQLIEDCRKVLNNALKRHTVITDYAESLPPVLGQKVSLSQVFVNLLHNAVQAMDAPGTIQIRVRLQGKFVQVSISDTGKGIPLADYSRIFNPFFTTKPIGEGTGLGLYISYGIVEKHKGELLFFSEEGKGTTFQVLLPQ